MEIAAPQDKNKLRSRFDLLLPKQVSQFMQFAKNVNIEGFPVLFQ